MNATTTRGTRIGLAAGAIAAAALLAVGGRGIHTSQRSRSRRGGRRRIRRRTGRIDEHPRRRRSRLLLRRRIDRRDRHDGRRAVAGRQRHPYRRQLLTNNDSHLRSPG